MMGRNQHKKAENTENQNASPSTGDHSSSSTEEQGLMENIPLTELGFRMWIIRNICELKEHVLAQCKEMKNVEKRSDEIQRRIDNLERNISELMKTEEYENSAKYAQVLTVELIKQKKGYQRSKTNFVK